MMFEILKERKLENFKYKRNIGEQAVIEYNGHAFDFDETSQSRLSIVRIAFDGTDKSFVWTCADDSTCVIDVNDVVNLFRIAAERANDLHEKYRVLRQRVENASSIEELNEIEW